jgi:molecular chaperone DnaK
MTNIIGIDLGTTFSAVAVIDETGRPKIVHNEQGQNITPSVVSLEDAGKALVGEAARKEIRHDRPLIKHRFKRDMGTSAKYENNGSLLTPTDLSGMVLKKLLQDTVDKIGAINEAVVTIPANFSNEAREATMAAAKAAGLNISFIINEPTAAALYYAFKSDGKLDGNYAIYDLGGGTFDVSIIAVKGYEVEVLASNGLTRLGGKDFDEDVCGAIHKKYQALTGESLDVADFSWNEAEEERKALSSKDKTIVRVMRQNVTFTRGELEELISTKIAQAELLCETTMEEAKLTPDRITKVFLVGGTTRTPAVRESVKRVFKQEPVAEVNVDEVVALGAALYAALKSTSGVLTPAQRATLGLMSVQERTGKSFGTLVMETDGVRGQKLQRNSTIIPKNTVIPAAETQCFYTIHDDQTAVNCRITESIEPETDPQFVKIVREGKLELPAGRPAGREIKVTYAYDENQIMHCTFLDVESGKKWEDKIVLAEAKKAQAAIDKFIIE